MSRKTADAGADAAAPHLRLAGRGAAPPPGQPRPAVTSAPPCCAAPPAGSTGSGAAVSGQPQACRAPPPRQRCGTVAARAGAPAAAPGTARARAWAGRPCQPRRRHGRAEQLPRLPTTWIWGSAAQRGACPGEVGTPGQGLHDSVHGIAIQLRGRHQLPPQPSPASPWAAPGRRAGGLRRRQFPHPRPPAAAPRCSARSLPAQRCAAASRPLCCSALRQARRPAESNTRSVHAGNTSPGVPQAHLSLLVSARPPTVGVGAAVQQEINSGQRTHSCCQVQQRVAVGFVC